MTGIEITAADFAHLIRMQHVFSAGGNNRNAARRAAARFPDRRRELLERVFHARMEASLQCIVTRHPDECVMLLVDLRLERLRVREQRREIYTVLLSTRDRREVSVELVAR